MDPFITPDFKIIDALASSSCYWLYIYPYSLNNSGQIFLEALDSQSVQMIYVYIYYHRLGEIKLKQILLVIIISFFILIKLLV